MTSIGKKPYIFVIFGGGGVEKGADHLSPSGSAHAFQQANNKGAGQTARMRSLLVCAFVIHKQQSQGFFLLQRDPIRY